MHTRTLTLSDALTNLSAAKDVEAAATAARLKAEAELLAIVGELPAEGTTRQTDGSLVAVIRTSLRRSVDATALTRIAPQIPEAIGKRLIRWKPELDTKELRYVQNNEPQVYALLAPAIEVKPAKPSITLEAAKQQEAA